MVWPHSWGFPSMPAARCMLSRNSTWFLPSPQSQAIHHHLLLREVRCSQSDSLVLPHPLQPLKGTDFICFVHYCVPRSMKKQSHPPCCSHSCAPTGIHLCLDKLRETLDRAGHEERPTEKLSRIKAPVFVGSLLPTVIWYPVYTRYCAKGEAPEEGTIMFCTRVQTERLRLRETQEPSPNWQNQPSIHSCNKYL